MSQITEFPDELYVRFGHLENVKVLCKDIKMCIPDTHTYIYASE